MSSPEVVEVAVENDAGGKAKSRAEIAKDGLRAAAGDARVPIKHGGAAIRALSYIEQLEAENEQLRTAVQRQEK